MPQRWEQMATVKECATAAKHGTSEALPALFPQSVSAVGHQRQSQANPPVLWSVLGSTSFPWDPCAQPIAWELCRPLTLCTPFPHLSPYVHPIYPARFCCFFFFHTHWGIKMHLNCHFSWSLCFFGCDSCCSDIVVPFICLSLLPEHRHRNPSEVMSVHPTVSSGCGK